MLSSTPLAAAAEAGPGNSEQSQMSSEFVYKYLVGEVAGQRGDLKLASNLFLDLAKQSRDARLAERAAKAAAFDNNPATAIEAASLWNEIEPDSVEAQQALSQMLVSLGRLSDAKPYLQKLLTKPDTRANGFLYLNTLLQNQTDKTAVLKLVQELAKPYPDLPEAHLTIAHSAMAANDAELALRELDVAEKLRPGWETSAIMKGQLLFRQSPAAAIEFYQKFLSRYENASELRLNFARLLVDQKRFGDAKVEFKKLIQASNGNPEVLVVVGLLSYQAMEYAEAERYLQQALNKGFNKPDQIYVYLGQIAEKQQQDKQALDWYSKVSDDDYYLEAKLNIANIISRSQGTAAAVKMLDGLSDLSPSQQGLIMQAQASLLTRDKSHEEAFALLEQAVENHPATPEIIYDYAMAAERVQRLDIMERELRKLIQLKPDFAQAYNALGYTLADRNLKLEEARSLIEKALTLSPNDHYILDSMGWVHYRMGKLDKAVDYLRRAYTAQTDPEIAAHLGEVLWQQGKYDEAMQTWQEALRQHPQNEVLLNTTKKFQR